jgi:hypothetical protein
MTLPFFSFRAAETRRLRFDPAFVDGDGGRLPCGSPLPRFDEVSTSNHVRASAIGRSFA